jgi:hypothetical protein
MMSLMTYRVYASIAVSDMERGRRFYQDFCRGVYSRRP